MVDLNGSSQPADRAQRAANGPRYLIPESKYEHGHPEIVFWTDHFLREARKRNVFVNIKATLQSKRSLAAAETMATAWYDFTRYVPTFITKAVAQTDDPERQHHLIQVAYDELGGSDKGLIHSNLFLEAIAKIGVKVVPCHSSSSIKEILHVLDKTLVGTKSQYGIVGLLMSFEIIAEENIETLFDGLCYDADCKEPLSASPFFKIHRADETEHIRHSVANFLRFCVTDGQREEFKRSFDEGIDYWHRFWDQCARMINLEADLRVSA
jgi:Iron-containing redox enzyme